ncbi:hypothetical protein E5Q_06188 [Mixia osmundae IAM 14324]|uniref:Major facilitator superfamily (MFS) profile domain-containing protein n=1 Tax=Mixia osmundae (strain CBS 9802 / IAM 14324 / JCM 22182 / KY 12970) TaxID=764103 RepID=G7E8M0_MIXOS|nr:hypothetical protein E5Q_06188 [Mixia osmundae IAM 14324]
MSTPPSGSSRLDSRHSPAPGPARTSRLESVTSSPLGKAKRQSIPAAGTGSGIGRSRGGLGGMYSSSPRAGFGPRRGSTSQYSDRRLLAQDTSAIENDSESGEEEAMATDDTREFADDDEADDDFDDPQKTPTDTHPAGLSARTRAQSKRISQLLPTQPGRSSTRLMSTSSRRRSQWSSPARRSMYQPVTDAYDDSQAGGPPRDTSIAPPVIPSALPTGSVPPYSTPLPTIPIIVLCICMVGEFLSASTTAPFIFFMIADFGEVQGEAAVGLWAGIVGSSFFLAQFFVSLLWASAADKYGRRAVLFVALLGNAVTLFCFGLSTNLAMAICIRMGQGLFNGAVGVARGAVRDVTDPTNEGRAYTLLGFCWSIGGIIGPIIGGLLEHPVENYPWLFSKSSLFAEYPYLLPCIISSSVTAIGCILTLFLGYDGGERTGGIKLAMEKDLERAKSLPLRIRDRFLGCLSRRHRPVSAPSETVNLSPEQRTSALLPAPTQNPLAIPRTATRQTTTSQMPGSAYGYEASFRSRYTGRPRASSFATTTRYAPDQDDMHDDSQNLNFVQRLLLANEDAVFQISDLWVAAATRDDDQYSQADWEEGQSVMDDADYDDEGSQPDEESREGDRMSSAYDRSQPPSMTSLRGRAAEQQLASESAVSIQSYQQDQNLSVPASRRASRNISRYSTRSPEPRDRALPATRERPSFSQNFPPSTGFGQTSRRFSTASRVPAIFANTGLSQPLPMLSPSYGREREQYFDGMPDTTAPLAAIPENKSAIHTEASPEPPSRTEKPSIFADLPMGLIAQYAILALHGTTCDQIFMSFLVTKQDMGGLELTAGHYAELVAVMCFFQMIFQFKFYPNVGPPLGKLSHLAMFRLGLCLYIPAYLLFPELRALIPSGNGLVMFGMILLSAIRFLANTCAYSAVMILTNALTPPHLIPMSNGLAQSAASLARFIGPLSGGFIWSWSISRGPDYYPYPANYAFGFFLIAVVCFLGLVWSFRLR